MVVLFTLSHTHIPVNCLREENDFEVPVKAMEFIP